MDQTPSSSSDLQGGSIKYVITFDDSDLVNKLASDSKAFNDFANNLDKTGTQAQETLSKISQASNNPQDIAVGFSPDVQNLQVNDFIQKIEEETATASESFSELSNSAETSAASITSSLEQVNVNDLPTNISTATTAASKSFDDFSQSAQSSLSQLKDALTNNGSNLKDALTSVAVDSSGEISGNIKTLAANLLVADENYSNLAKSADTTDAEMVKSAVNVSNYRDKLTEALNTQEETTSSTNNLGQSFGSMVASMTTGTLAAIGINDAIQTVKNTILDTISSASGLEQTKTTFTSLLGSAQAADMMLQQLSDLATHSSFDLPTLQQGVQNLLSLGMSGQEAVATITSLGDIAAIVGTQKLPSLTQAYAKIAEQGYISSQQLRIFKTDGVPLLEELASQSGKTTAQITKDMSGNGVSFGQVQQAIAGMTSEGGKFFDGIQKQSQTFSGTATEISNEFGVIGRAILGITEGGDIQKGGIFDTLKNGLLDFMNFLSSNATNIVNIFQTTFAIVGAVGQVAFTPIIMAVQLLAQNINIVAPLVGGLLAGFAAVQGIQMFVGGIQTAIEAIQAFDVASAIATLTSPWLLLGTVIAGIFGFTLYDAFTKVQSAMASTTNSTKNLNDNMGLIPTTSDAISSGLDKVGQKLQDINDKIADQESKFQQSLAQAVKAHQDKAAQLQKDINNENEAYADSVEKKKEALDQQNANEAKAHENHLVSLQRQLDQELATNHNANSLKAMDLQAAIAKENDDYAQKNATNLQTYQTDVANAKEAHDQKINDLTTQLKAETDLLQKHAADVASVRGVMIQDDIDKLKQSNEEQLKALDQQKQQTLQSVSSTNTGVLQQYDNLAAQLKNNPGFTDTGKQMGTQMGQAFLNALGQALMDVASAPGNLLTNFLNGIDDALRKGTSIDGLSKAFSKISIDVPQLHFASGGHLNAGQGGWVGDNPDGSLNSTSELFVPDVAGTIVPQSAMKGTGSRSNRPISVTNHIYYDADMTRMLRDMAWHMGNT